MKPSIHLFQTRTTLFNIDAIYCKSVTSNNKKRKHEIGSACVYTSRLKRTSIRVLTLTRSGLLRNKNVFQGVSGLGAQCPPKHPSQWALKEPGEKG